MERLDLLGFLLITFNCNVTIVGKIWLVFMILLRMAVLVSAGAPVYQDEQERFVCNTLQPGCANVCYDAFCPVSQLRFWLLQSLAALLPSALFCVYVLHRGAVLAARGLGGGDPGGPRDLPVPDFSRGYLVHLVLRVLTEAAFGASHYLLFGFAVPERFRCAQPPCSGVVDCYVSRPTEKSLLALLMCAASALSLLLSAADLLGSVRGRARGRRGAPGTAQAGARAAGGGGGGEGAPAEPAEVGRVGLPDRDRDRDDRDDDHDRDRDDHDRDHDRDEAAFRACDLPATAGLEPGGRLHGRAPREPRGQRPADQLPGARPRKSQWV